MKPIRSVTIVALICVICIFLLSACSTNSKRQAWNSTASPENSNSPAFGAGTCSSPQNLNNQDSLRHYNLGKRYAAQGRFELAKEEYSIALAAANNDTLKYTLMRELDNINLMIKSLR